jgi:hypothetical protein
MITCTQLPPSVRIGSKRAPWPRSASLAESKMVHAGHGGTSGFPLQVR